MEEPENAVEYNGFQDRYVGANAELLEGEIELREDGTFRVASIKPGTAPSRTYINRLAMILEGHRIEYSLRQAQKRFPTYSSLFPAAVQTEVKGLEAKCLTPTTWDSIQPSERESTLLAIYTVKFEQGVFDKCIYSARFIVVRRENTA